MYYKVEKTGCSERKGMVQIRYCLYLDEDDYGYEKHYVEVPIIPAKGYPYGMDETGKPDDLDDYLVWRNSLPTEMVHNPFHNHFVQVEPDITDEEIEYLGEVACIECKRLWDKNSNLGESKETFKNQPVVRPAEITPSRLEACEAKVLDIQSKALEKKDVVDIWQPSK